MKKVFGFTLLFFMGLFTCGAQNFNNYMGSGYENNIFKLNIGSLLTKTISVEYERIVSSNTSFAVSFGLTNKSKIPFSSILGNSFDQADALTMSKFSIVPSYRYYLSKEAFRGFYVAPFLKVAGSSIAIDYNFDNGGSVKTIPISGSIIGINGGVLIGAQYALGNSFSVDFSIFGPHYGFSTGRLVGAIPLNINEQNALQKDLDNLDLPIIKTTNTVTNNGASIKIKGPWMGVQSNIGIGYKF